ncbi:amidohydrolase family protein [Aliiglaciecola lipolytica]|uniref:Amidohydrolase 2 n=1 Tax=Aliiglaciecola lipolytica E3 TaxID=1127673 RepID=K6XZ31_9ALTE|nr:amidohydrolase family protein [Aliiglaciecola lipolytica]GAC16901.1 amidohydrolase 2 [Aliiglaciecola lipolytica E3]
MNTQRIDSHQHFWLLSRGDYQWLTPQLDTLYRDYLPTHLIDLMHQANVHKTIVVQAADSVAETHYMLELAGQHDFIAGVVGWIDMLADEAVPQLQQLAGNAKFKGIRPMLQDIEDPAWILNKKLDPVFKALIANGLRFDALVKPVHLPYLVTLLERYPELKVVINHGAKPDIASGDTTLWYQSIRTISEFKNVYCKLSGLITEAGEHTEYKRISPFMQHLYDCFGASHLMYGSDWPVLNLAADYLTWSAYVERFIQDFDSTEQQAIWHDSAAKFYDITK